MLVFLIFYYILRMIKLKTYIKWQMFIVYLILLIIDGYSLVYIPMTGWDVLGYIVLFFLLILGLFLFLLIINLITLIIRKVKKIQSKNKINIKKELIVSFMILAIFLPIIYGTSFSNKIKHERFNYEEHAKRQALEYLNKKYGVGDFKISEIMYYDADISFKVKTKYMNNEFDLYIDDLEKKEFSDNFIFEYYSYFYKDKIEDYYDLNLYLEKEFSKDIKSKYNIDFDYVNASINNYLFEDSFFGKIPTINDMMDYVDFEIGEIKINEVFSKDESDKFCKYIISIYEDLNYKYDKLMFKFNYDNPYSNSVFYKDSGYLLDGGELYLIYLDATPIFVKKDVKK